MPRFGANVKPYLRILSGSGHYLFLPVLTTAQRDALSPARGWHIYNSTTEQVESYNGSSWVAVGKVYGDATFLPLAGGALTGDVTVASGKTIDGVDLSVHAADITAHMTDLLQILRTGQYLSTFAGISSSATIALEAGKLYALPFVVVRTMTMDRLAINVQTLASSKSCRLGIYNDGTNLYPGTRLLDAGEVSVNTTGLKEATISQQLTKGIYWLVCLSEGIPTVYRVAVATGSILGLTATDPTTFNAGWSVSQTYGALPASFPAGGGLVLSGSQMAILARLLTLD